MAFSAVAMAALMGRQAIKVQGCAGLGGGAWLIVREGLFIESDFVINCFG